MLHKRLGDGSYVQKDTMKLLFLNVAIMYANSNTKSHPLYLLLRFTYQTRGRDLKTSLSHLSCFLFSLAVALHIVLIYFHLHFHFTHLLSHVLSTLHSFHIYVFISLVFCFRTSGPLLDKLLY